MSVHVFVGPTLAAAEVVAALPRAELHGPVAFGDVCRVAQTHPTAIVLIDGYFERVPAVWHKEILWAMSEGVHVFGASSMGALRAAELAVFGMVGVGSIFESFASGELEDDDEVTITHGPPESGYAPLSKAMVNLRATLRAAAEAGVLDVGSAARLIERSKARFYAERSHGAVLQDAAAWLQPGELAALRQFLATHERDQKREDAVQLLQHVASWIATKPPRKRVQYQFCATDAWLEGFRVATLAGEVSATSGVDAEDPLLEDLKVERRYTGLLASASLRAAALSRAEHVGMQPDAALLRETVNQYRVAHGLVERRDFEAWREEQELDQPGLQQLFHDEARVAWGLRQFAEGASTQLADQLRLDGDYGRLRRRALAKAQALADAGLVVPSLADVGIAEEAELWRRYFSEHGRVVPTDLALEARQLGFEGAEQLRVAVLRELCYRGLASPA